MPAFSFFFFLLTFFLRLSQPLHLHMCPNRLTHPNHLLIKPATSSAWDKSPMIEVDLISWFFLEPFQYHLCHLLSIIRFSQSNSCKLRFLNLLVIDCVSSILPHVILTSQLDAPTVFRPSFSL